LGSRPARRCASAQVLGMVDKILRERADDILDVGRAVRASRV